MEKIFYKNMGLYKLHRSNELDHEHGRPAILLKYKFKKSLVWCGTSKKDLITKEKPLIINLSKTKTYFYSTGIERVNTIDLKDKWVNYSTNNVYELSSFEQQELISKFVSFTLEQNPYVKIKNLEINNKKLEIKVQEQDNEIKQLKKQICIQSLKLKNRNRG
ncbi:MAG: hypothetical protein H9Q65_04645 [Spiroplasma ixodetis]|nr:hypothetical protein [Spiroplasma ixodetis]MBP1528511.1 hypothetical protein [Spiroplasma ixodetis]